MNLLRNRNLGKKKFYRQYPIFYDLAGSETFFIADFYCHENKLIIELDGKAHLFTGKKDQQREKILNLLGYNVIRFNNKEVEEEPNTVLEL